jgi:hypothetical protein
MAYTNPAPVKDLNLDLANFRTVPQADEVYAIQAMVSISPDRFWALMESLIDDGYLPTENILVLRGEDGMVVKEGNRRVAALKMIHGLLPADIVSFPDHIESKLGKISDDWKKDNAEVPCTIYEARDAAIVDRIVTLAHGKGEKAGRDQWNAVARARHNRSINKLGEPALDLLEKYLESGKNLTQQQSERWAGDYPITVLEEAMKRIAPRMGVSNAPTLARTYPSIQHREILDEILRDVGLEIIGFKTLRGGEDLATKYGLPPVEPANNSHSSESKPSSTDSSHEAKDSSKDKAQPSTGNSGSPQDDKTAKKNAKKVAAVAISDPKAVKRLLRKLVPRGNNRAKVVTLRNEALNLDLAKNPLAFCFLLRSMFEISVKAYCEDHSAAGGPACTKADGTDRKLVEVLREVTSHLAMGPGSKPEQAIVKSLHGAMAELGKGEGILSVTSMNQLIHNPTFSVTIGDISTMFGNVFPLLEAMNK